VVHWQLKHGCIPVTYDPAAASFTSAIAAAAKAWSDVACSDLCLDPPTESSTEPEWERGEREIHVDVGDVQGSPMLTTVYFENDTGRTFVAFITIDAQNQGQISDSDFLQMFGLAIGLGSATNGASSVMAPDSAHTALTAADETAVCALYGDPSYCGD
jgi:hypothetical protein